MRTVLERSWIHIVLAAWLSLVASQASASPIALSFDAPATVVANQLFDVDLNIGGLTTQDLAGFDIDVLFDPSLLAATSYMLGVELADPFLGPLDLSLGSTGPGVFNLRELATLFDFSAQPDSFTLATLSFEALATGAVDLSFGFVDLTGPLGEVLSVPSPGTGLLLLAAAFGFLVSSRKNA